MSLKPPPSGKSSQQERLEEEFINGQEKRQEVRPGQDLLPWQRPEVRSDVKKVFNLRIPEPYLLKLRFIVENTPSMSIHGFIEKVLYPGIDEEVERLVKGERR